MTKTPVISPRTALYVAFVVFLVLHIYRITAPPNGYHAWRESDTAAVTLNFYQENLSILQPKTNELSSSAEMARMEFPIYCYVAALGYRILGPNHIALHVLTVMAALLCIWLFYRLTVILSDGTTAAFAACAMSFSPLFFFYSYKMMPDIMMMSLWICSLYWYLRYTVNRRCLFWIGSAAALALSVCIKPFGLSIYLPLVFMLWADKEHRKRDVLILPIHIVIAVLPVVIWMSHSGWLLGRSGLVFSFTQYMFSALFFKKIFLQWPFELWVGWVMVPAFACGVYQIIKKGGGGLYFVWVLSAFLVIAVMASYSRQHDYYSLIFVPPLAVITGFGLKRLYEAGRRPRILLVTFLLLAPLGAAARVHSRFDDTEEFYEIRAATKDIIPRSSRVIVQDVTLGAIRLYQMNRKGWYIRSANEYDQILPMIRMGAEYLILVEPSNGLEDSLGLLVPNSERRLGPLYCYRLRQRM